MKNVLLTNLIATSNLSVTYSAKPNMTLNQFLSDVFANMPILSREIHIIKIKSDCICFTRAVIVQYNPISSGRIK